MGSTRNGAWFCASMVNFHNFLCMLLCSWLVATRFLPTSLESLMLYGATWDFLPQHGLHHMPQHATPTSHFFFVSETHVYTRYLHNNHCNMGQPILYYSHRLA